MGHERVGVLPRSRRWRAVVKEITEAATSEAGTQRVASATLWNVRRRFAGMEHDAGVQAAFGYIVGLATAHLTGDATKLIPRVDLDANPSALALGGDLARWVSAHAESQEYAALATRAAADAISEWTRQNSPKMELFPTHSLTADLWRRTAEGGAFSEVSRLFFAKLTERYLKYFLEREASAELTLRERELFTARLERHVDALSRHSFETTRIAQSFAAGWFNKHARSSRPSDESLISFLAHAFGKLRAELERERLG